jgi:hypothetical protein
MSDWKKGDDAVAELEKELDGIRSSETDFEIRLDRIYDSYFRAVQPFNLLGDDRVLGMMAISVGSFVEKVLGEEIERPDITVERLELVRELVRGVEWIPEGFRSSMALEIAFQISQRRHW